MNKTLTIGAKNLRLQRGLGRMGTEERQLTEMGMDQDLDSQSLGNDGNLIERQTHSITLECLHLTSDDNRINVSIKTPHK